MEMIWVESYFTMGSPTTELGRQTHETEHNVTLTKAVYSGKYEAQAQYEAVMKGNTNELSATPSNWLIIRIARRKSTLGRYSNFSSRLNTQQSANIPAGWAYVLPTESQWEYASVGAGTSTMYSWGDDINSSSLTIGTDNGMMEMILKRLVMLANMHQTHGAFSICMEMSWNGLRIGTTLPILLATL